MQDRAAQTSGGRRPLRALSDQFYRRSILYGWAGSRSSLHWAPMSAFQNRTDTSRFELGAVYRIARRNALQEQQIEGRRRSSFF